MIFQLISGSLLSLFKNLSFVILFNIDMEVDDLVIASSHNLINNENLGIIDIKCRFISQI